MVHCLMSFFKKAIKSLFSTLGYEISPKSTQKIRVENFQNLVSAYQYQIDRNNSTPCRPGNELRVQALGRLLGTSPAQAFEIISALSVTADIPGDVCEFGVAQGETSALMANEISKSNKALHLFDSFEGLPAPSEKDQLKDDIFALGDIEAYQGEMSCAVDMVKHRLAMIEFPDSRYQIHQGFIEEIIKESRDFPEAVSFAYVDFDFYEPIKIALDFLANTLSVGGKVMIDDYDFFSTGAKTAVDEFVEKMNSEVPKYSIEVADKQLGNFAVISKL